MARANKHRISVWSSNANPSVDPPLFRKSPSYVTGLLMDGRAFVLPNERGVKLYPPHAEASDSQHDELLKSNGDSGAIDCSETKHNGHGVADRFKRQLLGCEIRAMRKVANYGKADWSDRIVKASDLRSYPVYTN